MKNLHPGISLSIVFFSLLFSSCSREAIDFSGNTTKEIISKGAWSVDYYYAGQDKTALYSNFNFNFNLDGTINGTQGQQLFSGSWSTIRDVNRNDVLQMNINSTDPQLMELNGSWTVSAKDLNLISTKTSSSELRFRKL